MLLLVALGFLLVPDEDDSIQNVLDIHKILHKKGHPVIRMPHCRKYRAIETSEETAPGIVIDYTERGIVAIESLDASERLPLLLLLESIGV